MADQQLKEFGQSLVGWFKRFPSNIPRYTTERLPIIKWLPKYNRPWAVRDIIAGVTVGLIVVPQGMSYAKVAGLPVQHGLYSAYIGAIFYCFMGTSKDLTIGPTAVISLVTGELVTELAGRYTPGQVAAISCLAVGAVIAILGVLRLGIILDFFPTTVLVGYTTGAAVTIMIQQVPKWLGVPNINNREPIYKILINMFKAFGTLSWLDLVFGLVSAFILIAIGLAVDRWGRGRFSIQMIKISRFFIVTVLATVMSYVVNMNAPLDANGDIIPRISIVKKVPSGLPPPAVPDLTVSLLGEIAPKILAITLATLLEHIAIAKAFARRNRYQIDANQELLTLGLANVTASFFGAYTVTGSFSRSAVKFQCGVKSPFAGFVTGALVILAIFFLTPVFFYIPDAALSAVIMVAVSTLVSPPSVFYQYFKINLWDFLSAMVALFVTIFVSVEAGIAAGVAFSVVVLLFRVARPNFHILRQLKDRPDVFVDEFATKTFDTEPAPHGILVFRIEESTTFPNTETFKMWVVDEVYKHTRFGGRVKKVSDRLWSDDLDVHIRGLRRIAHGPDSNITDNDLPKLRAVILDFSAVNNIDSTGLQGLFDLRELLKDYAGVADYPDTFFEVHFVGIQANVLRILELSGITRPVGPIAMQKVEPLEDIVVETASNGSETSSSRDAYGSQDQILSNGGDHASRDQSEIDESGAEHQKDEEHELGDWNREVNHAGLGSGSLSVYGASPFLKEEGLVHLTVRDAIDAVLVRNATWRRNIVKMMSESSDEEEERNKNKP
ncbi:hypothetical protein BG006_008920 [Podila minutissima]|uniref:STAS domain-containing protein n=1 Tax=Podila minutissima TaxID=64525 RepID=A0A9P5SFS0_9FUNG|nr:hypothetical protein BG006_008920 [Podila minutissima]